MELQVTKGGPRAINPDDFIETATQNGLSKDKSDIDAARESRILKIRSLAASY
jgi:hypothetical protein